MNPSQNKVIVITGATSGIGLALARQFADMGFKVYGTARETSNINSTDQGKISFLKSDITDFESVKNNIQLILEKEKAIDILINNAGYGLMGPVAEISIEDFELQLKTNLTGLLNISQEVIKGMIRNQAGTIVNISSISAIIPTPFSAAYCASKSAVNALSEVMRYELKPFNIRVVTVQPGAIQSNFGLNASKKIGQYRHDSNYQSISSFIDKRAMQSQVDSTPADQFAKRLVKKLLNNNSCTTIRIGKDSKKFPFLKWLLPGKLTDRIMMKRFGLDQIH